MKFQFKKIHRINFVCFLIPWKNSLIWCCSRSQLNWTELNEFSKVSAAITWRTPIFENKTDRQEQNKKNNSHDVCLLNLLYRCYVYINTHLIYDHTHGVMRKLEWDKTKYSHIIKRSKLCVCVCCFFFVVFLYWLDIRSNVICHTVAVFFQHTRFRYALLALYQLLAS